MDVAYFIVSERPVDGYDLFGLDGGGRALAHANDLLDRLAAGAGVRALMDFFSADPGELDGLLGLAGIDAGEVGDGSADPDDGLPTLDGPPAEEWFAASDGLATVRALIDAVAALPPPAAVDPFEPSADAIAADLHGFESILDRLDAEGVRWHLSVDFGGDG